jgi:heterodisulfide reductase subunit A
MVAVCTCGDVLSTHLDTQQIVQSLNTDPAVDQVVFLEQACTMTGWENLIQIAEEHQPNRILIGACLSYVFARKIRDLGMRLGLEPALVEVVDANPVAYGSRMNSDSSSADDVLAVHNELSATLRMGLSRLKWVDPSPVQQVRVCQKALVIGGGIAGMTSALAIADHGFPVDLIEREERLGGNLNWLKGTLEGNSTQTLLEDTVLKVEKHPKIRVHTNSRVLGAVGQVGQFFSNIESKEEDTVTLEHGVTILATGGREAATTSYHYGASDAIITQKELEQKLNDHTLKTDQLESVVMIQCVDSREEPRNYCSRICCASALKYAQQLKEQNPEMAIYIFYRDMMTYGFTESYYTKARKAGVIFIPYDKAQKPQVDIMDGMVRVTSDEPIIGQKIQIDADLVVLSTGIASTLPRDLAQAFGAGLDEDGFFKEADAKWRPVDSMVEGVFACGLALSPRNITESIATAEAAAQRALRILSYEKMPAGKIVAEIRYSLCSLCEQCIEACPYSARIFDLEQEKILINAAMCQGCGSCATVCPNSASILAGFSDQQMFDVIDAALEGMIG